MTADRVEPGDPGGMVEAVLAGDRRALARAITLVESTKAADRVRAEAVLTALLPHAGKARRIGISGAPGAGKSTFIEAFGKHLTGQGLKVAVLAVDPSSRRSGGSILGDKTRMERLARDPNAFIRPSPAGTTLGGVARRTREVMLLTEAAGFDVVLVETVGVGQSETAVSEMVDLFVLLVSPGGGDDLQGIKRGVMELADLILVTKADGDLVPAARRAVADYEAALHLMRPKYPGLPPRVRPVSALAHTGIAEAWEAMAALHHALAEGGHLKRLRADQARRWFWNEMQAVLVEALAADPATAEAADRVEAEVIAGRLLPDAAARSLIAAFRGATSA
ncbi:MAG: methylmalonyl Co-A mutase-associated GTPase MeaB [Alphaproteobacteria bacterium]|nr:methylmalonyl Co-A mutase-associated GTPase MeaB [Alphaproteobacteria bacterium]MBU6473325.1 methylmalonyl Co-A mutase-associated GTPase MeaB [Alphaproteobacteria bacterium]MDE2013441.1 methylmalonyl Co-A mutase-associated GTPase MeaB [Alphaproteobacteria bacterium]MDE2073292.1 methylmalonyl Co-A mutase-associated GTPase MeaB [Alphaproteobacteria bacterium]MDE2352806.1 methylmalonyl Co-A mutase-associated GTPase MeaB [Alphaproteobacteria bacterium]